MPRTTVHRVTQNSLSATRIREWAELGEGFKAGEMSGEPGGLNHGSGLLNDEWKPLHEAHAREGILYTVYSFYTPIAWKTATGWVVIDQKWGPHTARHKSFCVGLHPRREGIWCPGEDKVVPAAEKPAWSTGRHGVCPDCQRLMAAPHGKLGRHVARPGQFGNAQRVTVNNGTPPSSVTRGGLGVQSVTDDKVVSGRQVKVTGSGGSLKVGRDSAPRGPRTFAKSKGK